MNLLEAALSQYTHIKSSGSDGAAIVAGQLAAWIDQDVCPAIQQLLKRADFQMLAKWSITQLTVDAHSRERQSIDAVDRGLVEVSSLLSQFVQEPVIALAVTTADRANGTAPVPPDNGAGADDNTESVLGLSAIQFIATRPWHDLVALADYFGPAVDLNLKDRAASLGPNSSHVQIAGFTPYFNPRLKPLGDFVSRMLLTRIEYWQGILQRFWVRCQSALHKAHLDGGAIWQRISEAWGNVYRNYESLRQDLLGDDARKLRDHCCALVQIYAAFRPMAKFPWLGLADEFSGKAATVRFRIERRSDVALADQVAAALSGVALLYWSEIDPDLLLAQKLEDQKLVVVSGPGRREVYWLGKFIEADWFKHEAAWNFLLRLAEHAAQALGVDSFDLAGARGKDARYRLKRLIPAELLDLIRPAGPGTHRLDVDISQVSILRFEAVDRLAQA